MTDVRFKLAPPEPTAASDAAPLSTPERSAWDWCAAALVFLGSLAYLRLFYNYTLINADEGIVLQGAQRVLEGEVPYRDFFSFYTPGSYYWVALFFKLFGSSILVGRALLMTEAALCSTVTYLLARRVCSRWSALMAAYFVTLTCAPYRFIVLHNWDSTLWACLALYCALRFVERPRPAWMLAAGFLAACTCLFEQSKGAGLILGLGAGFMILAWISHPAHENGAVVPLLDKEGLGVVDPPATTAIPLLDKEGPGVVDSSSTTAIPLLDKEGPGVVDSSSTTAIPLLDKEGPGVVDSSSTTPKPSATRREGIFAASKYPRSSLEANGAGRPARFRWTRPSLTALLAGFSTPFLLTLVYFTLKHSLAQLLSDWFWPLRHYSAVNKAPLGFLVLDAAQRDSLYGGSVLVRLLTLLVTAPWYIVPVLPFLACLWLGVWYIKARRESAGSGKARYYLLTSATLAGLLLSTLATGRADFTHLVYLGPLFYLVLAWILDGRDISSHLLHATKPLLVLFLFVSFSGFSLALLWQPLNARQRLDTRRGALKTNAPDHVIDYVEARVAPGETILVYPYLPLYYYLTATRSPGRYEYLMPGFHSPEQFQEMREALVADRTRVILFEPSFREKIVPGFPSADPSILAAPDPVESYITTHYRTCASLTSQNFWRFAFMIRKDLPCPEAK